MAFSEKGYHIAVSTNDGFVALWDLRKQKKVASLSCRDDNDESSTAYVTVLSFDPIGKYLAFGTSNGKIVVTHVKDWNQSKVTVKEENKKGSGKVSGLVWGTDALSLVASFDNDRAVYFWGGVERSE